jgi:hypothetical protein
MLSNAPEKRNQRSSHVNDAVANSIRHTRSVSALESANTTGEAKLTARHARASDAVSQLYRLLEGTGSVLAHAQSRQPCFDA